MTPEETAAVVHRLTIAYRAEATKDTFTLWHDHLKNLDAEIAFTATDNLIAQSDGFFPTIARFRETYRAEARRLEGQTPALPEPEPERGDPSKVQGLLAETRSRVWGQG